MSPTTPGREHTGPRGTLTEGTLVFTRGAADARLHAEEAPDRLFTASFSGRQPSVTAARGTVVVRYRLRPGRSSGDIALSTAVTWTIQVRGGASDLDADLTRAGVGSIHIDGGASKVTLRLPTPRGRVPIHIGGGASNVTILRPHHVAASLSIGSGAAHLVFDEQRLGAVGGDIRLESANGAGPGGYDIRVGSGASHLWVSTTNQSTEGERR